MGVEPMTYSLMAQIVSRAGWLPSKRTLSRRSSRTSSRKTRRLRVKRRSVIGCFMGIEPTVLAAGLEPASSCDSGSEPGGYAIRLREQETPHACFGRRDSNPWPLRLDPTEVLHHVELHPKHARPVGHLRIERSSSSLSESSGQPARHDPGSANGGSRTFTVQVLSLPPLPVGLRSRAVRGERIELFFACL